VTGATGPTGPTGAPGEKGAAGERGTTGPRGGSGVTGATGPTGTRGEKGATGERGVSGATGPAGVHGEKGATGERGPTGSPGSTGPTGAAGTAGSAATLTFASQGGVASGSCLNLAYLSTGQGQGLCPGPTSGLPTTYAGEHELSPPMPAGGARVNDLYAVEDVNLTGTETVQVAVIDNTTGATLLACTINSGTRNHCENGGASPPANPGDLIEVKVTGSAKPLTTCKAIEATFRY
jgi:hypothetical protein